MIDIAWVEPTRLQFQLLEPGEKLLKFLMKKEAVFLSKPSCEDERKSSQLCFLFFMVGMKKDSFFGLFDHCLLLASLVLTAQFETTLYRYRALAYEPPLC